VQQLADKLGVARTTVIDWRVAGMIPGSRVAQIAIALKISPRTLLPIVCPPSATARSRAAILQSQE